MYNVRTVALVALGGVVLALATLVLSPILTKNVAFLGVLPFAALTFLYLVLNAQMSFLVVLWSRSLMDHPLELTKAGGSFGIGALINIFVLMMAFFLVVRFPKILRRDRHVIAWLIYLGICILTVAYSPVREKAFRLVLNFGTYLAMFVAPFFLIKNSADKKKWIKTLLLSSFFPALAANAGVVTHKMPLWDTGRLAGTFTHPNILAFYLTLIIAITFYVLRTNILKLNTASRFFLWLYMADLGLLLIFTQTRSAWLSCAAFFVLYGFFKEKKFLVLCFIGALCLPVLPQVRSRLSDLSEGTGTSGRHERLNSAAWRMRLWECAIPSIKKRIVRGYGLESFQALSGEFFPLEKKGVPAHNIYVELIFETGLMGLLAYFYIFLQLFRTFWRRMRAGPRELSVESTIVFSYLVGYILVGVSDNLLHYLAYNWYFWFFMGVMVRSSFVLSEAAAPRAAAVA